MAPALLPTYSSMLIFTASNYSHTSTVAPAICGSAQPQPNVHEFQTAHRIAQALAVCGRRQQMSLAAAGGSLLMVGFTTLGFTTHPKRLSKVDSPQRSQITDLVASPRGSRLPQRRRRWGRRGRLQKVAAAVVRGARNVRVGRARLSPYMGLGAAAGHLGSTPAPCRAQAGRGRPGLGWVWWEVV